MNSPRYTSENNLVYQNQILMATAQNTDAAKWLCAELNALDSFRAEDIRYRITKVHEAHEKTHAEISSRFKANDDIRDQAVAALQAKCIHRWGEWRSGYEIGSYRICNICGKEDE